MYSELRKHFPEINHGACAMGWNSLSVFDVQNDHATLFNGYGMGFPNYPLDKIQDALDINKLEESYR
jgi:hypothetical protein